MATFSYKSNHNLEDDLDDLDDTLGTNMEALYSTKNQAGQKNKKKQNDFNIHKNRRKKKTESYLLSSNGSIEDSGAVSTHYFK